jgi:peptide/nickel transport system substrate-binding protein
MNRFINLRAPRVSVAAIAAVLATPLAAQTAVDVAIVGEPDTFDPMISTKDVVSIVTQHFVETLYTFDDSWSVVPLLAADMPEINEGGTTYTIPLREGVTFHDGSSMDSVDVVASLERWIDRATRGRSVAPLVEGIEASGPAEVTITLSEPYSPLLSLLAFSNSAAAVYPEEIIGEEIVEVVGTGPYQIEEHAPDEYLQLTRFDNYTQPASGAEERQQIPDEIRFIPVPDPNTRVEGLMSGQFAFADSLPAESIGRVEGSDVAEPLLLEPFGWPVFAVNHKDGLLTDQTTRRAVQAALPIDDMLFAAFGDERFYNVDGPMYPDGWAWRTDAGTDLYNQNDPEQAGELLEEAGYDGTPLRILTSRQYEFHFKMAEVAQMALESAGFEVDMMVVDWATLGEQRDDPSAWDIYITHSPFLPEPSLTSLYAADSRLGWSSEAKDQLMQEFTTETDPEARQQIFADIQEQLYEDVGFIKVGNFNALQGKATGLTGVEASAWPSFWNAELSE